MLHKHTHGLSNRLVGGGVGISQLETQDMGEGWSDFYGMTLLSDPADDVYGNYASGAYVSDQLSGITSNYYSGIRRYPDTTDLTKNPLTLKDIDPSRASAHTGIPLSPLFSSSNSNLSEVHNRVAVTWQAVPQYGTSNSNNFQIELSFDGRIRITCLGIAATDGLIGLSQGLGNAGGLFDERFQHVLRRAIGAQFSRDCDGWKWRALESGHRDAVAGAGFRGDGFTIGALHHFAWNTIAGPFAAGAPFSVTLTALDAGNNAITNFNGPVNLSGFTGSPNGATILITELNTNTPDEIEFMNVSSASVGEPEVYIYDEDAVWPAPKTVFTIPAGTTCAAGQVFRRPWPSRPPCPGLSPAECGRAPSPSARSPRR